MRLVPRSARRIGDVPVGTVPLRAARPGARGSSRASVCAHLRAKESAELLYERLVPFADQVAFGAITVGGSVARTLGDLAGLLGRFDDAETYFARASKVHEKLKAPYLIALTQLSWARVLLDRGPR